MKGRNRITKMTAQRGLVLVIFFGSLLLSVDGQLGRSCDNPAVCSPPSSSCFNRPLPLSPPPSAVPYVCDCSAGTNIGFDCASDNIARDLITCYGNGCRTGSFQSENYPNKYPNRWSATYLLYIPGATRINFEFTGTGGFGLESFKDDLYVGAGLDFIETDLSENSTAVLDGTVRFFDNRTLNGQIYPPPFSLETDTVWLFFSSDKNLVFNGWQLSWTAVVDTTPPTIIQCPMDITRIIERGTATPLVITWDPEPFANDLNPPVTLVASHDSGDLFDISTTTVVYTFRDRFENAANCTFVVDIIAIDRVPPEVFGCPEDINREIELGSADPIIFWVEPFATDLGEVTTVRSHEPSTPFPVGITQVIYTFSDDASPPNTSPCRFLVTVTTVDTIPPDISNCPEEGVRELIELGTQGVVITWTEPSATDISGTARLIDSTRRSGDFFQPGTEVVTYTYSDASNNMATCTFIIVVIEVDTTPPLIIERVGNIEQIIERGVPGIEIIWQEPSSTDVSNTDVLLSRSIAPGFFFTADATTVIYTFTDETGNTATDSFCVTLIVVDTTPPDVFGCPMDITREIELGSEDPVIFWIEPFATDIGEVTTVSTHQPATSFQVGSTLVTYTFTDDATPPNSEFCEFMVTVSTVDTTPPAVTCPMNIFDTVELGISGLPITWVEPVFSDVSGTAFVSERSNFPGEFFLVGSTAVMYSISDASQNTAICAFTITILSVDTTPPSVTCPADITRVIELGESGINVEWDLPSGTDLSEPVTIVSTTRQPGSFFTVGQIEITYVLTDAASNQNSCNFMVTVTTMDTTPPSIIGCPGTQEATIEFGLQGIEVSWIEPTAFDISNVANLVSVSALPGSLFMVGDTNVTYVFADSSGNLATCSFIVTVLTEDTTPPEIPNCPNTIQETIELGSDDPIIVWVEPVATDLSGASVFSNSHTSGSTFQVGETVVTYLFSDPFGNMAVCSFSVVVNTVDTTPPVISNCPVNQDVVVELGDESGTAQWGEPTATDLSGVAILSTRTHIPGETFPVGQTVVMYIFTDPSMNSDLCQFVVIVRTVDSINPVCQDVPEGISVMLELGEQGVTVEWTPPTCFDLSGVTTLTPSHLSGSFFLIDTTTDVTFTCVDPAGLTGMCSFPVVIIPIDTIAPRIISCPSQESTIVTIELGEPGVMVTWQEPMVSDLSEVVLVSQSHMSNQFFVVGPTTVTYVYRDSSNNMANCQFVVSVQTVDTVAPIISLCPVEQTIQVELGVTSAVAFWVEPTATDVSGTATLLSRSIGPGESVPLGTTIVNYIFTDASSNTATCTFSITVSPVDTTPPVVVCTEDVPFEVELGTTGTIAVWTEPTATDISGVTSLTERSHSPGSFFSVGKTTVTYVFSDNTGNSATCIFCVCITTVDTTPPTCANVPQGVLEVVELGVTGTLVDWVELTCEDQSGTAFVTERTHIPSSFFEVGMTTVTYTCTDTSGNSQLCPFVVTVITEDTTDPTCVNLPTGVVEFVELGVPGAIVNWQEPTCDDLSGTATVTMRSNAPFSFFSVGMTVVTYTCTDRAMNSGMCSFTVTVTAVDRTAPMCENVPMGLVGQVEVGMAVGTLVSWEEPTCNDVSQTAIVSNRTFLPGSFFLVGQTEVIYTCTDGSGNNEMCVFIVTVVEVDNTPPVIDCPEDVSLVVEIGTGGATATWIDPVATDLSGMATVSCDFVQGMFFPTGETTVTCIARDNSNNVASCTFIVIIAEVDSIPPIVTCPPDTSRVIEVNSGPVPVFFQRPTATDNSMVTPTVVSQSHSSGDLFDVGKTTVVFLYADLAGNQNQCSFCIEVLEQDTMSPLISACPRNLEQETTLELNTCFVSWTEPTVSDNSGSVSLIEQSHQPFSQFEAGVTTVTYTYADSANNQAMCSFTVTCNPVDMISPFVSCPGNVLETIPLESSFCFATWQDPQASDNSGTVFLNSQTHQRLTSPFPVGETAVTYTYGDPSNNIGMCSFTVTCEQVDGEPPVLVCPQDVTAVVIEGLQGTMVFLNQPTATDNSGQAPFVSLNRESNSFFPVGTTLVVVTATDASGNGATCSFNVIVIEGNPCDPNPCSNGGVCVIDSLTMFTCVCPDCFEGRICEISLDACSNNPCQNGAACRAVDGSCDVFTCECPPCFSGEFCQDFRDACENHQCRNGAECCPDVNCLTYSCQCPTCFNGPFCEVAINPCTTNLCQNGAQCLPDFTGDCSGYACICDGCFTGRLCNQPFDICQTNPCQNNGLCTNDNNDCYRFTCQCFGCFTGLTCELAFQNPCLPNPCTNGGQCTVVETSCSSYICNCPKGFIGINCETVQVDNSNPCNSFPCENGATCVASGINYICMCRNGFAGINCADSLVAQPQLQLACRSNPCQANAECINSFHSASNNFVYQPQYSCRCSNQFTGQNCGDFAGVALSFCNPNPCSNGGSCNNAYHSFMSEVDYVCTCPVGFRGQDCESDVGNPCDSSPCQNGGTCTPFNTYFSCSCLSGFSGLFCQLANAGNVPSVFNCPSDITVSTAGTSSQASWQEPISFGGVGTVEQVYNSHNPGDSFPVGETPVTYVFMDSALQFTTCSFFVIIRGAATNSPCDTNNPCPPNEVCIFSEITMTLTCEPFGNPPNFMPAFESRRKRDVSIQILLDDEYGTECPCLNGGRCIILVGNGTFCQCHDGYHGKICEDSNEQLEEVLTGDEEEERQEALFIKVILGSMLIMMVLSLIMLTIKIIKRKQEVKTDEKPVIT